MFELDPLACPCGGRLRIVGPLKGVELWLTLAAMGEMPIGGPCAALRPRRARAPPRPKPRSPVSSSAQPPPAAQDELVDPLPPDEWDALDPPAPDDLDPDLEPA